MRYEARTTGDEWHDTFPYSVIDTESGQAVSSHTHRQIAEDVADRLNGITAPRSIYDVTEADEQVPSANP